jgi:THUMP domain-like
LTNLLLKPEIQEFISKSVGNDISKMAFQKNPFPNIKWISVLNQISCKTKAKEKLPTFFKSENIIYPSKISIEQTSSEKTAKYKSEIVSGESLIDLTGGFGVDDLYFSYKINKIIHCEIDLELSQIVQHNFNQLKIENIQCYNNDSFEILKTLNQKIDWIYIDPSRRNESKGKVFMLKDCLPNVPDLMNFYFQYSKNILIKTAPILDISAGLFELKNVKKIHIVAVENEVKELLWEIEKEYMSEITIKTVNISKETIEKFNFILKKNSQFSDFSLPKKYLYEPNSSIMKSGGFDEIGLEFGLEKLHQHSHLYTSDEKIVFPGRIFEIEKNIIYNKKEMKLLQNQKLNLTIRNFPETVENIRKKWNIKDGGNQYCFFTTNVNDEKIVLICKKI